MRLVIEHLEALGEGRVKPENPTEGIYYEIKTLFGGGAMEEVMQYAPKWEYYSGDFINPIQCDKGG
ncbi:MAG: hypothetical protein SWL02_14840, partial [Pseudomonadota bacterium]|nr:hypothetical protein [Pseudomonadota bacterium]